MVLRIYLAYIGSNARHLQCADDKIGMHSGTCILWNCTCNLYAILMLLNSSNYPCTQILLWVLTVLSAIATSEPIQERQLNLPGPSFLKCGTNTAQSEPVTFSSVSNAPQKLVCIASAHPFVAAKYLPAMYQGYHVNYIHRIFTSPAASAWATADMTDEVL